MGSRERDRLYHYIRGACGPEEVSLEELTPEVIAAARRIADDVTARRNSLTRDEQAIRDRGPHTGYARTATDRKAEQHRVQALVLAVAMVLGRPNDVQLAEGFIADSDTWKTFL